jgi:hypothetical protein
MNALRRAFVGASTAWSIAILLAPVVASRPQAQASSVGYALALMMYAAGSLICHQRPERSFHLLGTQMPVCARCAGIYAGAAVAAIVAWFRTARAGRLLSMDSRSPARPGFSRTIDTWQGLSPASRALLVSALPTAGTLLYEWATGQTPGNWIRLTSGAPLGAAVAWIVCSVR